MACKVHSGGLALIEFSFQTKSLTFLKHAFYMRAHEINGYSFKEHSSSFNGSDHFVFLVLRRFKFANEGHTQLLSK